MPGTSRQCAPPVRASVSIRSPRIASGFGSGSGPSTTKGQFGKAWTSFDSIVPPQAADDYVEMFLWKQWTGTSVAAQVSFVAQAIRSQHPDAFVMVHVGASMIWQDAVGHVSNDFLNRACVDRYGTIFGLTLHPSHPLSGITMPPENPLWIRRRRGPQGEVWFVFNVHDAAVSTTLPGKGSTARSRPAWNAFGRGHAASARRHLLSGTR